MSGISLGSSYTNHHQCSSLHAMHLLYYTRVFCSLPASVMLLSPSLCFQLHLSVSLLLRLHRSLLIQESDFLLLVTLFLSTTHSQSIRTRFLILWLLWARVSPSLDSSSRIMIEILSVFFFFLKCSFQKLLFSFFVFSTTQDLESKQN